MAPSKKVHKCGVCKLNIGSESCSIQCDLCSLWVHGSCAGISDADLVKFNDVSVSFICSSCKSNVRSAGRSLVHDEVSSLNSKIDNLSAKFDEFLRKGDEERTAIKQAFTDAIADIKKELSVGMTALKSDIIVCSKLVRQVESSMSAKVAELEVENNVLYKKFNRADIVVGGLPKGLRNIPDTIIQLGSFYKIPVTLQDINYACYINNGKAILVKFNSVFLRDAIMKEYFNLMRTQPLLASNLVVDPMIPAVALNGRVFLNDHFSPAASKLNAQCRKLLQDKIISKFRVINAAKPVAKLTMPGGEVVESDALGCADLLQRATAARFIS